MTFDLFAERTAAINDVALFDVGDRCQIELTGRDRLKFLHNFCSNDIKKLTAGQGCEAFVTSIQGKALGHIFVFAEAESLWIESVPDSARSLIAHLDRYLITEDVRLTDRSADLTELLLVGSRSAAMLEQLGVPVDQLSVSQLPLNGHFQHDVSDFPLRSLRRVDWFEAPTWLLSIARDDAELVRQRLTHAGAVLAGAQTFHALRIAARFPLYGLDITEDQLVQEVGRTAQAISFTKGCYLGQEPIARIDSMGHVNRELCCLTFPADAGNVSLPQPGTAIFDQATAEAKQIGQITSSAWSLQSREADHPIALAYLRRSFLKPGSTVTVADRIAVVQ
jgi:folate-binding protein YgfZ